VRRLIINADDFGLTSGVNRAILESHQRGIVTSATLMASGSRFAEAASLANAEDASALSVGCHVVLVDGSPTLPPSDVSTLLEKGFASNNQHSASRLRDHLTGFARVALMGSLNESQLEAEIIAQIRKLQAAGIQVSHLDSHKHTHVFPPVLRAMLRAAQTCGVRAIRNPFEPLVFARLAGWKRNFQIRLLSNFRRSFRRVLATADVKTPDGCIGIAATGGLNDESFCHLIENLPDGTWEFVSHPGYNDADLDKVRTRLRQSRDKERAVLTSPAARQAIERAAIQLISYREL
jgi:hopanoid biosynthesis associated protein HpnK